MRYCVFTFLLALLGLLPHLGLEPAWGDGLEFVTAAEVGGVVHPTGYPVYSLLIMLLAKLAPPIGGAQPAVVGAHLVSTLALAAAAAAFCRLILALGERLFPPERRWCDLYGFLGVAGGLCLAWGETAFELGTTAEVYTLQLAFQILLLVAAVEVSGPPPQASAARLPTSRWILLGGLASGLALAHHRMAIFAVGTFLFGLLLRLVPYGSRFQIPPVRRRLPVALGATLLASLGLAIYLYLPLRAAANPPLNWGAPDSPSRFLWTVRGGEFVEYRLLQEQPGIRFSARTFLPFALRRAERIGGWMVDQAGDVRPGQQRMQYLRDSLVVCGIFFGIIALGLLSWRLMLLLLAPAFAYLTLPFLYNIADIEGYLLAAWVFPLLMLFLGIGTLWRFGEWLLIGRTLHFAPALLLAIPIGQYLTERPEPQIVAQLDAPAIMRIPPGQDPTPISWASGVFKLADPNAVILTEGDNDNFALLFARHVLGRRPDLQIVGTNFLKEEWYRRFFADQQPRGDFPPYIPKTGGGTPASAERFFERLFTQAVLPAWRQGRPVYFLTNSPLHVELYDRIGDVEPLGPILASSEADQMRFLLAPPPLTLFRLRPPLASPSSAASRNYRDPQEARPLPSS